MRVDSHCGCCVFVSRFICQTPHAHKVTIAGIGALSHSTTVRLTVEHRVELEILCRLERF
jgi:hypothetical protein